MNTLKQRGMHAELTLLCQGQSLYLKVLVKKEHNSKNIALRVMPLVLHDEQVSILSLVLISLIIFDNYDPDNLAITIAQLFIRNI